MANTIIAGNGTNNGLAVTSDATGALNILTGSGGGTAAISIDSSQNVTMAANLSVTGNTTVTGTLSATNGITGSIKSGTAVASTSGTSIDFTSLPTGLKRITVMFNEVSTSGTSPVLIQIGDGSVVTTGYISTSNNINQSNTTGGTSSTAGFVIQSNDATFVRSGVCVLHLINSSNGWVSSHTVKLNATQVALGGGSKTLSATLDRVRITTVNGTDTFDAGSINILFE